MIKIKEKVFALLRIFQVLLCFIIFSIVIGVAMSLMVNSPFTTQMIVSSTLSLVSILIMARIICKIYNIKMQELGILFIGNWFKNFIKGVCLAFISNLLIWLIVVIFGGYKVNINTLNSVVLRDVLMSFIIMLLVGYYEEVLTRGIMSFVGLKTSKFFNAIAVGVIFSLMHLLNPSYSVLSMINTVIIAVIFSMLTWISGDLWIAIGYHFFWNFFMGSILGVPVSGLNPSGVLVSTPDSRELLNGGQYGLEASLVATIFLAIKLVFIYFYFIKNNKTNKEPVAFWLK